MALERREVGHNAHDLASDLLARRPGALARDFGAPEERGGPLDAEEVLVALGEGREAVALPALADDLREGAARRMSVLLLALERGLHHLHRHVRRQPLERSLRSRVAPEPEDRARNLGDGQRCENEAQHAGQDPRKGAGRGCGRSRGRPPCGDPVRRAVLRSRSAGRLPDCERGLRVLERRGFEGFARGAASVHDGGDGGGRARVPGGVRTSGGLHPRADHLRERAGRRPLGPRRARQEPLRHQVVLLVPRVPQSRGQELLGDERGGRRPGRGRYGRLHDVQEPSRLHRVPLARPPVRPPPMSTTPSSGRP